MTTLAAPMCAGCTRLQGDLRDPKCEAFPDGIPKPILLSEADHRQPYPGDHGLQFDPKNEAAAKRAAYLIDGPTEAVKSLIGPRPNPDAG